jgi:hypothetical protein
MTAPRSSAPPSVEHSATWDQLWKLLLRPHPSVFGSPPATPEASPQPTADERGDDRDAA